MIQLPDLSNIAAATYWDQLWVWRCHTVNEPGKAAAEVEELVYEGIPCRLSRSGLPTAPGTQQEAPQWSNIWRIYARPEIVVKANDRIEVLHQGRRYKGLGGESHSYEHSHTEIELTEVRIA